jgi:hypothetical protein
MERTLPACSHCGRPLRTDDQGPWRVAECTNESCGAIFDVVDDDAAHRGLAPTVPTEHEFALDTAWDHRLGGEPFQMWRWLCSCGERGNWQSQSDSAAYHGWLRHCGVSHDYTGEGS